MPRNTRTGAVLEQMVLPALEMGGYQIERQVRLTDRLGGGRHYGDIVASKYGERIVISLKWQQSSGTAEQKVPYEFMCLADVLAKDYRNAETTAHVDAHASTQLKQVYHPRALYH